MCTWRQGVRWQRLCCCTTAAGAALESGNVPALVLRGARACVPEPVRPAGGGLHGGRLCRSEPS